MSKVSSEMAEEFTGTLLRVLNKIQQTRRVPRDFGDGVRLTLLEAHMCSMISRREGVAAGQLSVELGVGRSAISQTITKLKAKGLVSESPDPADAKRKRLYITEAGGRAVAVADSYLAIFSEAILGETQEELDAYMRLIHKLEAFNESSNERLTIPSAKG